MRSISSFTLILFIPLITAYSFRKAITFKKKNDWINLGKITTTGQSNIRAMLITYSDVVTTRKPDLYLMSFTPEDWEIASKAEDCESLVDNDNYVLQILLNDTWVKANKILFPEPTMQFIATNCHSPFSSNLQGRPIDLEITNCTYELPEKVPDVVIEESKPKPEEHPEKNFKLFAYTEREVKISKLKMPNTSSLIILVGSLLLVCVLSAKSFCNSVHFILILSVLMRVAMHILLFLELTSGFYDIIITFLEVGSQFGFILSYISMILSYPPNSTKFIVVAHIIAAIIYYFLGTQHNLYYILGLRGGLAFLLMLSAIVGTNQKNRITSKGWGLVMGLMFIGVLTFIESLLLKCAGSDSILLNRMELVRDYPLCSNKYIWAPKYDYLSQAIVMGLTVLVSGLSTKRS